MACADLGAANEFNIFVFGDHTQSFVDSEGRVAVGGNATYRSYGVGSRLTMSTTRNDLIVYGNIDILSGSNFAGNTIVGPDGVVINYTMTNNNRVPGQPLPGNPLNFAAARRYLSCASTSWSRLPANGTVSVNYGQIVLTGTNPSLNVFDLDGNSAAGAGLALSAANGVNIITPAGSTTLVNVRGVNVGFGSYTIFINGLTPVRDNGKLVLWNFHEANAAFSQNLSIIGSVLAPFAPWSAVGYGNIEGTMIAESLTNTSGSLEAHHVPFTGCLPDPLCLPQLDITKTVNDVRTFAGFPGTPLAYTVHVRNTGGEALTNIRIADPDLALSQVVPLLQPGEDVRFTVASFIPNIASGTIVSNTATAQSDQTPVRESRIDVTVQGEVVVQLIKLADRQTASPGDTVTYRFAVVNANQIPLYQVRLQDPLLGLDITLPSFIDGDIAQFDYTIPATATLGSPFANTATLTAQNPAVSVDAQASVTIVETPSVGITKTASTTTAVPGDTVTYTVAVVNNSIQTTVFDLTVTDPFLQLNETIAQLDPLASIRFTGTYTVPPFTPAGAMISNIATLQSALGVQTASASVIVGSAPALAVTKVPRQALAAPGDTVIHDVVVTNTGNIPLSAISLSDPAIPFAATVSILDPTQSESFEISTVVPTNALAGTVLTNTVIAVSAQTPAEQASATVTVTPVYSLAVLKTPDRLTAAPGDIIDYTITVTNSSNAPVTNVQIIDSALVFDEFILVLEPGGSSVYQVPYQVPADEPGGSVINNIVTAATDQTPAQTASAQVLVVSVPSLSLTKTAGAEVALPGDVVTFTLRYANTGNTTLTSVRIVDAALGIDRLIPSLEQGASDLFTVPFTIPADTVPNSVLTNTSSIVSEQTPTPVEAFAVVNIGVPPTLRLVKTASVQTAMPGEAVAFSVVVTNTSTVPLDNVTVHDEQMDISGTFPLLPDESRRFSLTFIVPADAEEGTTFVNQVTARSPQTADAVAMAEVTAAAAPALHLAKTVNVPEAVPGQTVFYTITLSNTGNTELSQLTILDPLLMLKAALPTMLRSSSQTYTVPFTVPADATPGTTLNNTVIAAAEGVAPVRAAASLNIVGRASEGIQVQKLADPAEAAPGETVVYTIILANPTDADLANVQLDGSLFGFQDTISLLRAGDTLRLTVPFEIPPGTAAGTTIVNTIVASTDGQRAQAQATVTVLAAPGMSIAKTTPATDVPAGGDVVYTVTVVNTGNIALTGIRLSDPTIGLSAEIPSLPAGESRAIAATWSVPALPPGTVVENTASAVSDQTPDPVTAVHYIRIAGAELSALLAIGKTADKDEALPGQIVNFSIVVSNPSAVTLTDVIVRDSLIGWIDQIDELEPGQSESITVPYTIPADAPAGTAIVNTSTAVSDQTVPVSATAAVDVAPAPSLTLVKRANLKTAMPGETVVYTIELSNTGNVPLTNVFLGEDLLGIHEMTELLEPGVRIVYDVPLVIPFTLRGGSKIANTASAYSDQTARTEASADVDVDRFYAMTVRKDAEKAEVLPGQPAHFAITISNTGNSPLTGIRITDSLIALSQTVDTLEPGASIIINASYPVAADTPPGTIIGNRITAAANELEPVFSQASIRVLPGPRLTLIKRFPSIGVAGERVRVLLFLVNAGNVELHHIRVNDVSADLAIEIDRLLPGYRQEIQAFYTIPSDAAAGSIVSNRASAVSDETGLVETMERLQVVGLQILKSSRPPYEALVGETIAFELRLTNPIPLTAYDIVVKDPLPFGVAFIPHSLTVNAISKPGVHPASGIAIDCLPPGESITIAFRVQIQQQQPNRKLGNEAVAHFTYRAKDREVRGKSLSNRIVITILDHEE